MDARGIREEGPPKGPGLLFLKKLKLLGAERAVLPVVETRVDEGAPPSPPAVVHAPLLLSPVVPSGGVKRLSTRPSHVTLPEPEHRHTQNANTPATATLSFLSTGKHRIPLGPV